MSDHDGHTINVGPVTIGEALAKADPHQCSCRICAAARERTALVDENDRLRAIEEWARGADHHPGCSGGFGTSYPCKCGRREFWPDLEVADRG